MADVEQVDALEALEDPAHRRPIGRFVELIGNGLSGGRQLVAQAVLGEPIDQQTQHHHQTQRHDALGFFDKDRGGQKERILEETQSPVRHCVGLYRSG